jgi:hypothetical protein
MQGRPGFARLLPLTVLTGPAAGTVALLASARPVQAPAPRPPALTVCLATVLNDGGCSDVTAVAYVEDPAGRRIQAAGEPEECVEAVERLAVRWSGNAARVYGRHLVPGTRFP